MPFVLRWLSEKCLALDAEGKLSGWAIAMHHAPNQGFCA